MTFLRTIEDMPSPKLTNDMLVGEVVNNNDPLGLSRIKVRIPELHGFIPDNHIPWAARASDPSLGSSSDLSHHFIPRVGSKVIVEHPKGNIYNPVYTHSITDGKSTHSKHKSSYPNSYGFEDSNGNYYLVDMSSNNLSVNFNGSKVVNLSGDESRSCVNINLTASENINLDAGNEITITAKKLKMIKKG